MFIVLLVLAIVCVGVLLFLSTKSSAKQTNINFVCQRDYQNSAWGFNQHNGMYVDSNGDLYKYNDPDYKDQKETNSLDEIDLNRGESTFVRKLSLEERSKFKQLFQDAKAENLGLAAQKTAAVADAGVVTYNCYAQEDKFRVYNLLQLGGQPRDNAGPKGQKLGDFLKSLFNEQQT